MSLSSKRTFNYRWSTARRDLAAGATVAAIAVPQAIAYALIAGVDPRLGLYSATVITIVASILGSSAHLINGPTNAISLVVFSALASFDGRFDAYQALFLLGIIAGSIQILIAVFKLGDLTRYVSESVILGFMAGAGLLIALGQIGNFVGATKKGTADQSVLLNTWLTLRGATFNPHAIGLGVGTIAVVLLLHKLITKYKLPRLDMLAGLILASLVAAFFGWSSPAPAVRRSSQLLARFQRPFRHSTCPRSILNGSIDSSGVPSRLPSSDCSKHSRWPSRLLPTPDSRSTITVSALRKALAISSAAFFSLYPAQVL
jgi:SulP family sulfate permease